MTLSHSLFGSRCGIIVSCDVHELEDLRTIIRDTCHVRGVVGYKLGAMIATGFGLPTAVENVRSVTDLPVLYDHQKFGTDIPEWCSSAVEKVLAPAGIQGLIIFAHSGPETLRSCIKACFSFGIVPIVGGVMTHKMYLIKDGGYIGNDSPTKMYAEAARMGTEYFVVPGNQPLTMTEYVDRISKVVSSPKFLFPGIGTQGGDLRTAFEAAGQHAAYAIVGRQIISQKNRHEAALKLCSMIPSKQKV